MVEPVTTLTAAAIATMIATKAFEKTGEKIGEAVGGLIPKFLSALRRKDPKTIATLCPTCGSFKGGKMNAQNSTPG
jgi:hypothetical protein